MDWSKWIADLLAAGIGGLIGGTLGAYLKGYWTKKGEHLATYEDIQSLLAQERGKAYEREKGKQLATHEDIENVRNDIRLVTKETETIKAQIGAEQWHRQIVWNERRTFYMNALETIHEHRRLLFEVEVERQRQGGRSTTPEQFELGKTLMDAFLAVRLSYQRFFALSEIFSSPDASRALRDYINLYPPQQSATHLFGPDTKNHLNVLENALTIAAKNDLKVSWS